MFRPIRYVKSAVRSIQLAISNLQRLVLRLTFSIDQNTAATAALLETAKATLEAAKAAQVSTAYVAAAEKHSRQESGRRHEF